MSMCSHTSASQWKAGRSVKYRAANRYLVSDAAVSTKDKANASDTEDEQQIYQFCFHKQ